MAHAGGQVGRDDVTMIGKRGPKGGTTLKSAAVRTKNISHHVLLLRFKMFFLEQIVCKSQIFYWFLAKLVISTRIHLFIYGPISGGPITSNLKDYNHVKINNFAENQ